MKTGAIVCFVIAALATITAINNIIGGANRPEGIENLVGYAVGAFLLPIAFLTVSYTHLTLPTKA